MTVVSINTVNYDRTSEDKPGTINIVLEFFSHFSWKDNLL